MTHVQTGRHTVAAEQEVTVFLIGMRVGRLLRVDKWLPVMTAMPRMLRHLENHPEAGLLNQHAWFGRTSIMLTYWQSAEHLQRFAADADAPHLAPWRDFMKKLSGDPAVGIWHETYTIPVGQREVIYANMPLFGLGKALGSVPVGPGAQTARQRLAGAGSR